MKYDWGLVLSGGGTRGFAHIGAIRAIEEAGIRIDVISGTSVGSIVGAMYADGFSPEKMLKVFRKHPVRNISRLSFSRRGFLSFTPMQKKIAYYLNAQTFEELQKPLYVCISNLTLGKVVYVHEGPLEKIIRASSSIPILVAPVPIGDDFYVDGAVFDNFPVKPIREQCHRIIGINVMPHTPNRKLGGLHSTSMRTLQLLINAADEASSKQCDVLIEPEELADFGYLGHRRGMEMYHIGYEKAQEVLNAMRQQ